MLTWTGIADCVISTTTVIASSSALIGCNGETKQRVHSLEDKKATKSSLLKTLQLIWKNWNILK